MHSLRWLYNQIGGVASSPIPIEARASIEQEDVAASTESEVDIDPYVEIAINIDGVNADGHLPATPRARSGADNTHQFRHTPVTPRVRSGADNTNQFNDSGYYSANGIVGKRRFEDDETDTTPTRTARARPPVRYREHNHRVCNEDDTVQDEAQRLRHDSVLSTTDPAKQDWKSSVQSDGTEDVEEEESGLSDTDDSETSSSIEGLASFTKVEAAQII